MPLSAKQEKIFAICYFTGFGLFIGFLIWEFLQ